MKSTILTNVNYNGARKECRRTETRRTRIIKNRRRIIGARMKRKISRVHVVFIREKLYVLLCIPMRQTNVFRVNGLSKRIGTFFSAVAKFSTRTHVYIYIYIYTCTITRARSQSVYLCSCGLVTRYH